MNLKADIVLNLKIPEVIKQVERAAREGMRDVTVAVAGDAIGGSPAVTGNNRRSIFFGVSGMGHKQGSSEGRQAGDTWTGQDISVLNESKLEGAVYSTSGYGGFLETGTRRMGARPYFKPALDRNFTVSKLAEAIKRYL